MSVDCVWFGTAEGGCFSDQGIYSPPAVRYGVPVACSGESGAGV